MHWLGYFALRLQKRVCSKCCPECISETSGLVFMMQMPHESPLAIIVHWLGCFPLGHNKDRKGPKMPKNLDWEIPQSLVGWFFFPMKAVWTKMYRTCYYTFGPKQGDPKRGLNLVKDISFRKLPPIRPSSCFQMQGVQTLSSLCVY